MMTRIFIVEDHEVIRESLRMMLEMEEDLQVCGEADSGEAAFGAVAGAAPDLVLIDVSLPGMSGIELVERLVERQPDVRCLMVSGHREIQYAQQALAVGAQGYIVKNSIIDELIDGIRHVMRGDRYLCRSLNHL